MKINGATPVVHPAIRVEAEEYPTTPTPVAHVPRDEQSISWDMQPHQPGPRRVVSTSLRHKALENPSVSRADTTPPGQHSKDSQLLNELDKGFGELYSFSSSGRLTQSSLRDIAAQKLAGD